MATSAKFIAYIDYEDAYVQPIILSALQSHLPPISYMLADESSQEPDSTLPQLHIRQYESLPFEQALSHPRKTLLNSYVIRKALIRKHYLAHTVHSHVTKQPSSALARHFKPSVSFELDYAEFLDDALVEAFELREAFEANEGKPPEEREWWILKPGMSDRGRGIRLFSSEDELRGIFEQWEAENPESEEEEESDEEDAEDGEGENTSAANGSHQGKISDGIMTSHLRHFTAQPYIHPPLLVTDPESSASGRKFHVRTYVVCVGALCVYVYTPMLALFANDPYAPPWTCPPFQSDAEDTEKETTGTTEELLRRMRNTHLTNTCVQAATGAASAEESAYLLSALALPKETIESVADQIKTATSELFRAAVALPTHFQPLSQAFEVFGLDYLVDSQEQVWLLEVNAFPDFAQTGDLLEDVVVRGLWEEIVGIVIAPWADTPHIPARNEGSARLTKVLDIDMGRN